MAAFESVPGGPSPQQIRELAVNNPRELSLGFATLVIPAHAHTSPGMIYTIHYVAKFSSCLGQPASTQWDDRIFGSIGNPGAHQNPITMELPGTTFSQQNGSHLF
jgi:hypothetical protein